MERKAKAASVSVASNTFLLIIKASVGLITGSVSVLSAAADSVNDLVASLIALYSVRVSGKPADTEHPYGHGKIENVSGAVQAILIFTAAIYIIREAVNKILNPKPLETLGLGMIVMGITCVLDLFVSRYLLHVARETDSAAIKADAYHLTTDVWTSLGVLFALVLVQVTKIQIIDPIFALVVAALILRVAYSLTAEALHMLLDTRLPDEEVTQLQKMVINTPKVVGYHKLRTRKAGSSREIDYHLIVPAGMPVLEAHRIAQAIEDKMQNLFPDTNIVTHIEPDTVDIISEPGTKLRKGQSVRKPRRRA